MTTQTLERTTRRKRFGITERKKAEIDQLTLDVLDAQNTVVELQAVVESLTQKAATYGAFLAEASSNKAHTLANKNQVTQVVQSALDLLNNSGVAYNEIILADAKTKDLARMVKNLMDKLIYSAEVVNKLANVVIRKKEQNPLISDDLVSMINQAGTDANNTVALMLVALQSVFTAQASNIETEADAAVEIEQAKRLYMTLVGPIETKDQQENDEKNFMYGIAIKFDENSPRIPGSLVSLLYLAYHKASIKYSEAKLANDEITKQLATSTSNLNAAQINLKSLQASLAAATAAALAS